MARVPRVHTSGICFHILNRANSKLHIFNKQVDYKEFIDLLMISLNKYKINMYAFILMPTHWHFVCSAQVDGEISRWMAWLQMMHTRSWHKRHDTVGRGHFYQGRYKSFIIQKDIHFLKVCRYVERNALRAGLVHKAEHWEWSSSHPKNRIQISPWPVSKPDNYLSYINENMTNSELDSIRRSVTKNNPYGSSKWSKKVATENNIETSLRSVGRPKKK